VFSAAWLALIVIVSLLMVSSWRYPSFKQLSVSKPRATVSVLLIGLMAVLIVFWSQPVLLVMAVTYVGSGILIRTGGLVRRLRKTRASGALAGQQIG
jgi:CDP-diacylglycerol--serine O-phosphatidyltransferase